MSPIVAGFGFVSTLIFTGFPESGGADVAVLPLPQAARKTGSSTITLTKTNLRIDSLLLILK
jgi:hypothetical protein